MSIQGINVSMTLNQIKPAGSAGQKSAAAIIETENPSEEKSESTSVEASEGLKGGSLNVYA